MIGENKGGFSPSTSQKSVDTNRKEVIYDNYKTDVRFINNLLLHFVKNEAVNMKLGIKQAILDKAIDLFYEVGFVKASIRDIAKDVSISKGTIYFHFKNKEEILYRILVDLNDFILAGLRQIIQKNSDPVRALKEMMYWQICLTPQKRKEIKIYMEEQYLLSPELRKDVLRRHREVYELYYKKVCEIDSSLLRNFNRVTITFSLFGMINWVYRWFRDDRSQTIEQVAADIVRMAFFGFFKEEAIPGLKKIKAFETN